MLKKYLKIQQKYKLKPPKLKKNNRFHTEDTRVSNSVAQDYALNLFFLPEVIKLTQKNSGLETYRNLSRKSLCVLI